MTESQPPTLECDLVMKGGIASGLVYPTAVAELSRRYGLAVDPSRQAIFPLTFPARPPRRPG